MQNGGSQRTRRTSPIQRRSSTSSRGRRKCSRDEEEEGLGGTLVLGVFVPQRPRKIFHSVGQMFGQFPMETSGRGEGGKFEFAEAIFRGTGASSRDDPALSRLVALSGRVSCQKYAIIALQNASIRRNKEKSELIG